MMQTLQRALATFGFGLVVLLFLSFISYSEAAPARRCNPSIGKQRALEYIQSNRRLAELAGMEFQADLNSDELASHAEDDGEILTDIDIASMDSDAAELAALEESEEFDPALDIDAFREDWLAYMDEIEEQEDVTSCGIAKRDLMKAIVEWLGTRYRFGGTNKGGIDCSAFTQSVFNQAAQITLPRTARWQHTVGMTIQEQEDLRYGDLIFFNTRRRVYVSHVGIYLGNNLFAHSSSRYGVTVSSLESPYYKSRFIGGRRLTVDDVASLSPLWEDGGDQDLLMPSDTLSAH